MSYRDAIDGWRIEHGGGKRADKEKRRGRSASKIEVINGTLTCEVKMVGALRMRAIWKPKMTEKRFGNGDSLSAER
jgi:hypothetical protein